MHNFRELKIWNRSRAFVRKIYELTKSFPPSEQFGLINQIRRSAVSIPSNIAEGCGRGSDSQLAHFLDIAHGSSCELETQILLAIDLEFIAISENDTLFNELHEIQKMILGFKGTLLPKRV